MLKIIFNNVLSNACSHGFDNTPAPENVVRIDLEKIGGDYVISIANNGIPCPVDMTATRIKTYGATVDHLNHCGIGGYEIDHLMKEFGGSLDIVLDGDNEFPVEYRLRFPNVSLLNN